jgi:uncharacterized protein with FMN-binding domain
MRRAISAVVVTAAAVVLVASFRTHGAHGLVAVRTVARHASPAPGAKATATATATATARSTAARTLTGDVIPTQFGNVQVAVRVRGGRLLGVQALQLPFDHPRSQFISEQADPILRQEALQAQSARIDILSGATYTSDAYAQSLQSALDRAR